MAHRGHGRDHLGDTTMTEPYIGEIQIFGFNFAPRGWAQCAGQLIPIQQNTALFSLLGVTYGGNGTTNFALPNFQGNAACNRGQGPGLQSRDMGETFGTGTVTLTQQEIPSHTHGITVYAQNDSTKRAASPSTGNGLASPATFSGFAPGNSPGVMMAPNLVGPAGNGQPHANQQPYMAMNFCIALSGVFPQFG
jgi:microcystin-dependent protein